MPARKDKYYGDKWIVDFNFVHSDGSEERVRRVSPVNTKRGAQAYERKIRYELLNPDKPENYEEIPTFSEFQQQFIDGYAIANNKASEVKSKEGILRRYLIPAF